ncbi:hypothetical protein FN846DRAFT_997139 [Sphaerosporella brunnea]|uniref:Uncharacterized protein n=1 Tax=Sphaerosporella brunnea TaxID=1250544 RepID=A0A5J5EJH2_9PEZI|nr:hypothetical protein FN846DRAFT_997139 [Sphaerosporella brunnea]
MKFYSYFATCLAAEELVLQGIELESAANTEFERVDVVKEFFLVREGVDMPTLCSVIEIVAGKELLIPEREVGLGRTIEDLKTTIAQNLTSLHLNYGTGGGYAPQSFVCQQEEPEWLKLKKASGRTLQSPLYRPEEKDDELSENDSEDEEEEGPDCDRITTEKDPRTRPLCKLLDPLFICASTAMVPRTPTLESWTLKVGPIL